MGLQLEPDRRTRARGWVRESLIVAALGAGVLLALFMWGRNPSSPPIRTLRAPETPNVVEAMPVGNLPGWRQVFADDFNGSTIDIAKWRLYYGQPGSDTGGWFDPRHASVSNGNLVISGYRDPTDGGKWTTAGLTTLPGFAQTYGKYLVRFRFDPGVGIGHTVSLATANGTWPPEIDFSEDNGSARDRTLATFHFSAEDHRIYKYIPVDLTHWHTVGLEWTPGALRYTLDGRVWFTIDMPAVPAQPMGLAIQTQAWPCVGSWGVCPNASTPRIVRMHVDWVVAYAYSPGTRG